LVSGPESFSEPEEAIIDLEAGWVPWNDAPFLIVTA
jgi:hypothetical protein